MSQRFKVVIPARYGSTRFPGKVLADMGGRPMIAHVYARACQSGAEDVVIATDDERVERAAKGMGATVCMTASSHQSGSDRIAEVVRELEWPEQSVIVNVQGDEPCIPPENIRQVADNIGIHDAPMATLVTRFRDREELEDANNARVVVDRNGYALYFSRAVIPFDRDGGLRDCPGSAEHDVYWRHIGLYAYRAGFLKHFTEQAPCAYELAEKLEQLRVLWMGEKIHTEVARVDPPRGVDTPADLEYLLRTRKALFSYPLA